MNYVGNEPAPGGLILVGDTNPIGSVLWGHKVPDGSYLRLNGQIVAKATYPDLWVYAQGFLTADQVANPGLYKSIDALTFALPKLDGLFLRAQGSYDAARTSGVLGALQNDDFKSHNHPGSVTTNSYQSVGAGGPAYGSSAVGEQGLNGVSVASQGGLETRGANVALIPCVKALRTILMTGGSIPLPDVVMLQSQDAAASAQLDFVLPAGYDSYELRLLNLLPTTADSSLIFRCSNDGGATFLAGAADYEESLNAVVSASNNPASRQGGSLQVGYNASNNVNAGGWNGTITAWRPSQANGGRTFTSFTGNRRDVATAEVVWTSAGRVIANNLAVNALRILAVSGTLASGRVKLYGYR